MLSLELDLEFEVGDKVLLKVLPWKGVMRFGKKGKLAPRYVGPFKILEMIGLVAYRLRLPKELSEVHDTFHVSNLKKCLADAYLHVPLDEIEVDKTLHFVEKPVEIMDREVKTLKRNKISIVKVRWNSKHGPEFTWEHDDHMKASKRGKLNPHYIGHFKFLAKVGTLAYRLELPEQLIRVHSTFYVFDLKKCCVDEPLAIPLDEIQIDDKLNFIEEPVEIMDREVKRIKQSRIPIVKVHWNSRRGPEFTWECEDQMKKKYPHLFVNP
ncbi:hypothetical protein Tco_1351265 [Tanacetum coccineum]